MGGVDGVPAAFRVHVELTFNTQESVAQMIRLYVMTWQIEERRLQQDEG